MSTAMPLPSAAIRDLGEALANLSQTPYPHVENPRDCPKRASVALVIRIQPGYSVPPTADLVDQSGGDTSGRVHAFFRQPWVAAGDPQLLYIKRAARVGDRWTGHTAFPGGRRDPEDEDDRETAIRETREEVGLELNDDTCISVGNLPQKLVTTSFGKVPLMVLCPYVFLLTRHDVPPLSLQPTEVSSAHWIPIRYLLSPTLRTYEPVNVSERFARQRGPLIRRMLRLIIGQMLFSAIQLVPAESTYCFPETQEAEGRVSTMPPGGLGPRLYSASQQILGGQVIPIEDKPLILWGLTLDISSDFFDLLPPHDALGKWRFPTFSPPDLRAVIWLMTRSFDARKAEECKRRQSLAFYGKENESGPFNGSMETQKIEPTSEFGMEGLSNHRGLLTRDSQGGLSSVISVLLAGYFDIVKRAVAIVLAGRAVAVSGILATVYIKYRRRRS